MKFNKKFCRAIFSTVFLFGLLTWLYVIAVQVTHPDWMAEPFTHLDVFPLNLRVDLTGIVGFIASALSFLLWRLAQE
jgi:heme/copper-type cytochrome/quinol oxidase subunit 3